MPGGEKNFSGHRERIRTRFLRTGLEGFQDYETLELLLTFAIPRKDVKPLAKELINRFGTVSGVINATPAELLDVPGAGPTAVTLLRIVREMMTKCLEDTVKSQKVINSREEVYNFLRLKIGTSKKETLMVIFLDSRRQLIDYKLYHGTVDHATIYAREVIEQALLCHACAVVLAHNHPSGNNQPSQEDIQLTGELKDTLQRLSIHLLDHLIVTQNEITSVFSSPRNLQELPKVYAVGDKEKQSSAGDLNGGGF